jgi:hypothetical protein
MNLFRPHCAFSRRVRAPFVAMLLSLCALTRVAIATVPNSEYLLLRAIYNGTNGAQWVSNTGWVQNNPADVCSWYGITCNPSGTNVLRIELSGKRLIGTLPPSLEALLELEVFDVSDNFLEGALPSLTGLVKLKAFDAQSNNLFFSIPPLSGLTSLEDFRVNTNGLSGPIPPLRNLPNLKQFHAYRNSLSGRIPDLSGAPLLKGFLVENNSLTGVIPPLATLSHLESFSVSRNQLTGALPNISALFELKTFRVDDNQLSGILPTPPGNLIAGSSRLCLNQFTDSQSNAWNIAVTGSAATSWNTNCIVVRNQLLLAFGAPPVLTPGGSGRLNLTASPTPSEVRRAVFGSLTLSVCSVNSETGRVDVSQSASVGAVCSITADVAGDTTYNSAPQVQQDIVIAAAAPSVVNQVPTLSPWAMLGLFSWLAAVGAMGLRRGGARRTR